MAIVNKRAGSVGMPWDEKERDFTLYNEVTLAIADVVDANTVQCLDIPAHCLVMGVMLEIITPMAGTATLTGDIGVEGGDTDGFSTAAARDLKAAAKTVYLSVPADDYPVAGGYLATAASVIQVLLAKGAGTVTTAPKFRIWAFCRYIPQHVT